MSGRRCRSKTRSGTALSCSRRRVITPRSGRQSYRRPPVSKPVPAEERGPDRRRAPRSGGARPQILVEPVERVLPRLLGGGLVVARRRVVVEAVLGAFVDMALMHHLGLGQRLVEGR